jgi:hypothetical protein
MPPTSFHFTKCFSLSHAVKFIMSCAYILKGNKTKLSICCLVDPVNRSSLYQCSLVMLVSAPKCFGSSFARVHK